MALAYTLGLRALSLVGVLFIVLLLVVVTLGATGFSDRMLTAIVSEEMRGTRQGLAETIKDPERLEETLRERRVELEEFYGLDSFLVHAAPGDGWSCADARSWVGAQLTELRRVVACDGHRAGARAVLDHAGDDIVDHYGDHRLMAGGEAGDAGWNAGG